MGIYIHYLLSSDWDWDWAWAWDWELYNIVLNINSHN